MDVSSEIRVLMADEWVPFIYAGKIRPQRTRAVQMDIPERENDPEIQYTLLGIELKSGKTRVSCPDLATARYLRVFARLGCRNVAVPYDITKISAIADDLETAWQKTLLHLANITRGRSQQSRARQRSKLVKAMRSEVAEAGAGELRPSFSTSTKQRMS